MSQRELRRVEVISRVASGDLRLGDAAKLLQVSYRQAKRLSRRFRQAGAVGLRHGNAGRRNRGKPRELRQTVLDLVREKYSGDVGERFGPTLAAEHLAEEDGMRVHRETLRRWMLEDGLWVRMRGAPRAHRQRRERKEHFGELVQLDGSFHNWFEGRGPRGCLMDMVDDATGVTHAWIGEAETTWAAVHVPRGWIEKFGVPLALYTDWKNVYKVEPTAKQELRGEAPLTQFGRMCARLGIVIIAANSPQAKGRVERKNGVHQDRLIKKLRRKGISSYAQANAYLEEYLLGLNTRFGRVPAQSQNYHRTAPGSEVLDATFRLETKRTVSNDWVVRYHGHRLQLLPTSRRYAPRQESVVVCEREDGQLEVHYRGNAIPHREIAATPSQDQPHSATHVPHVPQSRPHYRHGPDHPYRRHAAGDMKRRRLKVLKQRAAARAVAGPCATPNRAAVPAALGSAPAPATDNLFQQKTAEQGDIFNARI
jgi:transposase